jgi:hypothetical protein
LRLSGNNCANAKPLSPTNKARLPVFVEFTGFPWIENVAPMLQLHRCLGEDFENGESNTAQSCPQNSADLEWRETKDV